MHEATPPTHQASPKYEKKWKWTRNVELEEMTTNMIMRTWKNDWLGATYYIYNHLWRESHLLLSYFSFITHFCSQFTLLLFHKNMHVYKYTKWFFSHAKLSFLINKQQNGIIKHTLWIKSLSAPLGSQSIQHWFVCHCSKKIVITI